MRLKAREYALGCSWDAVFDRVYAGYETAMVSEDAGCWAGSERARGLAAADSEGCDLQKWCLFDLLLVCWKGAKMDKREFLKASGAVVAGAMVARISRGQTGASSVEKRTNWAGNYTYQADHLDVAATGDEVKKEILGHARVKALGARHSFNSIADTKGEQILAEEV